jgi:uncharacterized protein
MIFPTGNNAVKYIKLFLLLAFSLYGPAVLFAKSVPPKPVPARLVNDLAGILAPEERNSLERKLRAYEDSTSSQIAVYIDKSLEGGDLFTFSQDLFQAWGIGQEKKNNGVLLVVFTEDRKVRIHVGYGLEPVITDAASFFIIDDIIKPNFRNHQYYRGIDQATGALMSAAAGEFKGGDRKKNRKEELPAGLKILIFALLLLFLLGRKGGGGRTGGFIGGYMAGRMMGGGWGNFSGGSGGFGGGFGGGRSGGGGASGGW